VTESKGSVIPTMGPQLELSDEDVYEAMSHLSGYVDITTEDFREIYRLAFDHALGRVLNVVTAGEVMTPDVLTVRPGMPLEAAALAMAERGAKAAPVVDAESRVVGMLSETDLLRHLGADTFARFLVRFAADPGSVQHALRETLVASFMASPAVTVREDAPFSTLLQVFKRTPVSRLPVVDETGVLVGMLTRKDFMSACGLEVPP
jgi:CBS-domain-containing membrane protein